MFLSTFKQPPKLLEMNSCLCSCIVVILFYIMAATPVISSGKPADTLVSLRANYPVSKETSDMLHVECTAILVTLKTAISSRACGDLVRPGLNFGILATAGTTVPQTVEVKTLEYVHVPRSINRSFASFGFKQSFNKSEFINVARFPLETRYTRKLCPKEIKFIGFNTEYKSNKSSHNLEEVTVQVSPQSECMKEFSLYKNFSDNYICTGLTNKDGKVAQGLCRKDSGFVAVCNNTVVGILIEDSLEIVPRIVKDCSNIHSVLVRLITDPSAPENHTVTAKTTQIISTEAPPNSSGFRLRPLVLVFLMFGVAFV